MKGEAEVHETLQRSPRQPGSQLRYFFHLKDGETLLDEEGIQLDGIEAAKVEAILTSGEMIRRIPAHSSFWISGEPWQLWVTNTPDGSGTVHIRLTFSGYALSS